MANAAYLTVGRRSCPYREAAQNYGEKREEKLVYGVEFRMPMPSYTAHCTELGKRTGNRLHELSLCGQRESGGGINAT